MEGTEATFYFEWRRFNLKLWVCLGASFGFRAKETEASSCVCFYGRNDVWKKEERVKS